MAEAVLPSVWMDPRFRAPALLVGSSLIATAALCAYYWISQASAAAPSAGARRVGKGFVLCPQMAGLTPPPAPPEGAFVVLWLAGPDQAFVEATWARVVASTKGALEVVVVGEDLVADPTTMLSPAHGVKLGQRIEVASDCVVDVLLPLASERGKILCGRLLENGPSSPPSPTSSAVGQKAMLKIVDASTSGEAWSVDASVVIDKVSQTGHVVSVRVLSISSNWLADDPAYGHGVAVGDSFDVTWDCVLALGE